ncbi:hypothetical protein CIRMBP1248_00151 [Enterococcus cecorum]|nr:hypothetical protein CIRMBP1216_00130 [Enterococcus cecorum]CAI3260725.1 hypothetical protein CIRMBP1219_00152 [Enterococcus cecorum]CAI3260951.1 hypothetical protein CIRMBP1248_00151 [Enterococcus cecorum]CAI3261675.1 hypothetical protein CIRMBP1229_00132 [Enterococcus cecorum]CAI3262159.1 hypothetical protein CIRMBP1218_00131 [Enterococcus cecorum]
MRTDLFMNQEDQLNQEILNYLERMKFSGVAHYFCCWSYGWRESFIYWIVGQESLRRPYPQLSK